jgi:hypothetical protein
MLCVTAQKIQESRIARQKPTVLELVILQLPFGLLFLGLSGGVGFVINTECPPEPENVVCQESWDEVPFVVFVIRPIRIREEGGFREEAAILP